MDFKYYTYIAMTLSLLLSILLEVVVAEEEQQWVRDLTAQSSKIVLEDLRSKFEQQENIEGVEEISHRSILYIFVSTSMPKTLLQNYMQEAKKYGGVLVFKGLPLGSFRELSKFIVELTKGEFEEDLANVAMQIDDEAFDRFAVTLVPTIVLSRQEEFVPNSAGKIVYDKMIGNVPIKYALGQFADLGDLKQEALECLNVAK